MFTEVGEQLVNLLEALRFMHGFGGLTWVHISSPQIFLRNTSRVSKSVYNCSWDFKHLFVRVAKPTTEPLCVHRGHFEDIC